MKQLTLIILFFSLSGCDGQNKKVATAKNLNKDKTPHLINKNSMKQFILEEYKDWEYDDSYTSSTDEHRFLKKGNEKAEIYFHSSGIQLRLKSVNSPFEKVFGYSNSTKSLLGEAVEFYGVPIKKNIQYNEKGQIIKEIDYEKPYKFSIEDLIEKIKEEYNVDLGDKREGAFAGRREKNGIFYYEVNLESKKEPQKIDYILIDGNTGKTLFTSYYYMKGGGKNPFDEYLETLKTK